MASIRVLGVLGAGVGNGQNWYMGSRYGFGVELGLDVEEICENLASREVGG